MGEDTKRFTPKLLTAWATAALGVLTAFLLVAPRVREALDEMTSDPAMSLQIRETQKHFLEKPIYDMSFVVDQLGDVRIRAYQSDSCGHITLARPGAMSSQFFPVPPLTSLTMQPPAFSAGIGGEGCPQSEECLYMDPEAHGHYEVEEIGWQDDWLLLDYHYEDGCKERVAIHPSGTTASVGWPCCVHGK